MLKIVLLISLNLILMQHAFAENAYVGVAVGQSNTALNGYDKPLAYKIFVGAQLTAFAGFELAYIDLDKATNGATKRSTNGVELTGVGIMPFGNGGELFVKLGIFARKTQISISNIDIGNADGTDLTYGIGANFPMSATTLLRMEYQEFREDSNLDLTNSLLSLGLMLKF